VPFPEDSFSDGGGGGSARVVPDHFGTDWAAKIGNRDVRMKTDHVKTTATTEEVSSNPRDKGHWIKNGVETPPTLEKTEVGLDKRLANRWSKSKIKKKSHAGRGQETIWEIPV
jgi:endo-beta-N-acetylglucosaminidase D